jgi:site-specific DNA recombinase
MRAGTKGDANMEFKNAIGYIRISTENQAGDDRFGIEAQREKILSYANANGYNIVRWYQDEISGTADNRPEFDKILNGEDVTNPPYEAVIVYKNDRVARDTKLYFYYLYSLEKRAIKLLSTQEQFVEGNEFANIYRALLQFVAEQERINIAKRTGSGRAIKAAAGGYSGGRAPYGYGVSDGVLVIKEDEAAVVRLIFEKRPKMPMLRIAEWLNDNGYRSRSDGKFYSSNIKSVLDNEPLYRGMYRYGKGKANKNVPWVKGVHEPILEVE